MALTRSGQSAETILTVRAPQSKPARVALRILSASIRSMTSTASAAGWPLRTASLERKRVAAQVGHDDPISGAGEQWRHVDKGMDVVRPAVQQNDRRTFPGSCLGVTD